MAKLIKRVTKKRADKYEEKLAIKGGFANAFKVIRKNKEDKEKEAKKS